MSILNTYFDQIYILYITKNEKSRIQPKLEYLNIDANYFKGVDARNEACKTPIKGGAYGHVSSFIKIVEDAQKKEFKRILILEPDIYFCENFNQEFKKFIGKMGEWKVLHLGASPP